MKKPLLSAAVAAACYQSPAQQSTLPRVEKIDGDRVHKILRPDAIRSIGKPQFIPASHASSMRNDEPVVGVAQNGAYSTWHLDHHEIRNDQIGSESSWQSMAVLDPQRAPRTSSCYERFTIDEAILSYPPMGI